MPLDFTKKPVYAQTADENAVDLHVYFLKCLPKKADAKPKTPSTLLAIPLESVTVQQTKNSQQDKSAPKMDPFPIVAMSSGALFFSFFSKVVDGMKIEELPTFCVYRFVGLSFTTYTKKTTDKETGEEIEEDMRSFSFRSVQPPTMSVGRILASIPFENFAIDTTRLRNFSNDQFDPSRDQNFTAFLSPQSGPCTEEDWFPGQVNNSIYAMFSAFQDEGRLSSPHLVFKPQDKEVVQMCLCNGVEDNKQIPLTLLFQQLNKEGQKLQWGLFTRLYESSFVSLQLTTHQWVSLAQLLVPNLTGSMLVKPEIDKTGGLELEENEPLEYYMAASVNLFINLKSTLDRCGFPISTETARNLWSEYDTIILQAGTKANGKKESATEKDEYLQVKALRGKFNPKWNADAYGGINLCCVDTDVAELVLSRPFFRYYLLINNSLEDAVRADFLKEPDDVKIPILTRKKQDPRYKCYDPRIDAKNVSMAIYAIVDETKFSGKPPSVYDILHKKVEVFQPVAKVKPSSGHVGSKRVVSTNPLNAPMKKQMTESDTATKKKAKKIIESDDDASTTDGEDIQMKNSEGGKHGFPNGDEEGALDDEASIASPESG